MVFRCEELGIDYPVFTTRPDTLFGATFFVMAPEHPDVFRLNDSPEVHEYVNRALNESVEERGAEHKQKTGVALGRTVTNPVTGEQIPMFVADYVLMEYGTGAIMAVPAHDERDYDFATKFDLPIRRVIECGDLPCTGRRPDGQLRALRRHAQPRGVRGDHRLARVGGPRQALGQLPPARLAAVAPALLGLPDPGRLLRRARHRAGARTTSCRSSCPTSRTTRRRASRRWRRPRTGSTPPARSAAGRRGARPTRWTRSSTRPGTSCATATRTTTEAPFDRADRRLLDAGRPVHRRRRARDPAPAVRALLRQGAGGHGLPRRAGAVRAAVHPGDDPARRRQDVQVEGQRGLARRR